MFLAFPDACVYLNHRDPAEVIPSITSLYLGLRRLYSDSGSDPSEVARQQVAAWSTAFDANIAWRAAHADGPAIVDIHYLDLIADPLDAVRRIYETFGLDLTRQAIDRMERFLAADRDATISSRPYGLADFGLTAIMIEQALGAYISAFDVARERAFNHGNETAQ